MGDARPGQLLPLESRAHAEQRHALGVVRLIEDERADDLRHTGLERGFLVAGASWGVALLGGPVPSPSKSATPDQGLGALILALLLTGLAAPVLEELVFRGVLFRRWRRTIGPMRAALASSALFAVPHPIDQFLSTLVYAMLAVLLYTSTRTLWVPIAVHVVNNVLVVCVAWRGARAPSSHAGPDLIQDAPLWWVPVLLLLPSLVWFTWFMRTSWSTLGAALPPYERAPATAWSEAGVA